MRQGGDDRRGGHLSPQDLLVGDELDRADRHRERLPTGEHQRIIERIPAEDEPQDDGDRDARHAQRQDHSGENTCPGATVDLGGFLDFQRDLLEEAAQHPDGKRQSDELIGEDQPGMRVVQADLLIQQIERDHEGEERHEPKAHEDEGERVLHREIEAGQCVGGGDAGRDRQRHRADGDDDAVQEKPRKVRARGGVLSPLLADDERRVIVERWREHKFRRYREHVARALQ